jgi:hypothetical protein
MTPQHILDDLGPDDRVAVLACEGELYFLVHRATDSPADVRARARREGSEVVATHMGTKERSLTWWPSGSGSRAGRGDPQDRRASGRDRSPSSCPLGEPFPVIWDDRRRRTAVAHSSNTHRTGSRRLIGLTLAVALVVGIPAMQFGEGVGRDLGGEAGGLLGLVVPLLAVGVVAGALIYYLAARRLPSPGTVAGSADQTGEG